MIGLRAPAIGPSLARPITQVSGRAAAAAVAAAAATGLAAGGYVYQPMAGGLVPVQYSPYAPISRTAPVNPASTFMGNAAAKAPSLGNSAAGAASGLEKAAATGAAPTAARALGNGALGGGAATAAGGAARALSPIGKLLGGGLNPFTAILPDLLFPAGTQKGDAEAAAQKQADRDKAQRKGDNGEPPNYPPLEAGVRYIFHYLLELTLGGEQQTPSPHQVPFFLGDSVALTHDAQTVYINGEPNANTKGTPYIITGVTPNGITRENGSPVADAPPETTPDPGAPLGVDIPPTNSDSPQLPGTASQRPSPTRPQTSPSTGAPKPSDGKRPQNNPSKPTPADPSKPGGENSPTPPQTPLPSVNQSPVPSTPSTLPSIPAAPETGSASVQTPIFPAPFTLQPGIRTEQPYEPIQRDPPASTPKPGCADPCMQELMDNAKQNKKDAKEKEPIEITIKVFKVCKTDESGDAEFEEKTIQVPKEEADNYKLLYARIAKLEALQCNTSECIAAVPEWWQVRLEGMRPQLVILFAEELPDGKLGRANNPISVPHSISNKPLISPISSYTKGNYEGILTLKDNSKLIVNALSAAEAERVINEAQQTIDPRMLIGSFYKIGTRRGQALRQIKVYPKYAKFFSQGLKNLKPDWIVSFNR